MASFARALKEARRYWGILAIAILCSLGVAALWGANIAALFPIIETTLHGKPLQAWNQERLDQAKQDLAAHQAAIEDVNRRLPNANAADQRELKVQLEVLQTQVHVDQGGIFSAERLKPIFDRYLPTKPFPTVVFVVVLVVLATALKQCLMISNDMLVAYVSQSIVRDLRGRIFDKALALDRPGFNVQGIAGFAAHITHTCDMLASGITSFYGDAVTEPLRIVSCLVGAMWISWRLTLISLIFAPLAAFMILYLNRKIRGLSRRILDRSVGFHHVMLEVFNNLLSVQANTMEDFERRRFGTATANIRGTAVRATLYNSLASPVTELLGMGMLCIAVVVSGYLVINQETKIFGIPICDQPLSLPSVTVFFGMLIGAADPLRKLSGVIAGVNNGMAAANMLYPLLDLKSRLVEAEHPQPIPSPLGEIDFRDVSFSYDGLQQVIQQVNLRISAGERLAVVGPNGGGKSTLINLLCRFYDPQQGDVLVGGVSLRNVSLRDLRNRIAIVTQQTELFNETVFHNIRYGRWDATEAEIIAAARLARADEFITGFPDGYRTVVGPNGQRLSGGQRQRIALARAFLRSAEILILDEATSQIDVESERLIHEALAEYARDRTLVMVTHRESTLALATRIVRVEYGRLEEVALIAAKAA
jgi:ATP-binding cassette, subfamily B, bacterial MsbA